MLRLQVWHLLVAFLGALAAPVYVVGAAPIQVALGGVLIVALIAMLGARRARRDPA